MWHKLATDVDGEIRKSWHNCLTEAQNPSLRINPPPQCFAWPENEFKNLEIAGH